MNFYNKLISHLDREDRSQKREGDRQNWHFSNMPRVLAVANGKIPEFNKNNLLRILRTEILGRRTRTRIANIPFTNIVTTFNGNH